MKKHSDEMRIIYFNHYNKCFALNNLICFIMTHELYVIFSSVTFNHGKHVFNFRYIYNIINKQ